jgi:hypothetical protein
MRARRLTRATAIAATGVTAAWGCNVVIDSSGYYEVQTPLVEAGTAPDAGTCFAGTNRRSLEQACTSAACVPYSVRLPACDAGLCPLAASVPSAGSDGGAAASQAEVDGGTDAEGGVDSCSHVAANPSTIIYVTGSTALASFIGEVSSALASQVTIVYQESGSCVGVRSAIDPANNVLSSANGTATYYTANGTQQTCTLEPSEGLAADIGASDVFYSTCYLGQAVTPALPADVGENYGPVQIMNFAVPQASTQQSISLSAAYYVFGFGGTTYPVPPWTDPTELQIRNANSGTQALIAAAVGVPPAQWKGVNHSTSQQVGDALVAAGQSGNQKIANSALGILASDYLLQNAQALRGLAVQDENAGCGYYPNSTAFARDNANTRDGHYPLWGPSHFYARVDPATSRPLKAGVATFIDGLNGVAPLPGLDLVAEYASKGLVPECAMHVTRTNDGGDYTPFKASSTCNCYFDLHANGATSCQTCSANSDCPSRAPNCNKYGPEPQRGYCDL